MSNVSIGSLRLGDTARTIAAVTDEVRLDEILEAMALGLDAVEFRIDLFRSMSTESILNTIRRLAIPPTMATIRSAAEGGKWSGSDQERLQLIADVLPLVDSVDIESSSLSIVGDVVSGAKARGKTVILSHHDFSSTPSLNDLERIHATARNLGADIVKIAVFCNEVEDVRTLARFTLDHARDNIIMIGMGPHGACTRVLFPILGSLLTYTFLGEPTAPGQIGLADLQRFLDLFCRARNA